MRRLSLAALALMALLAATGVAAQTECGPLDTHYGPFDYRTDRAKLPIVERYHFTPKVELLLGGISTAYVEGDISYTLHAFPNHHRALASLTRLAERTGARHPPRLDLSVDCYFERALRFRPDDLIVRMLFADYLTRTDRGSDAEPQLDHVSKMAGDNPLTHLNVGRLYMMLGRHEKAVEQVLRARELGIEHSDLEDDLKAKNLWPASASPTAPAAAASDSKP
jgi:tetratricopeptide (TPR) repeat protein